jgi:hypothetical protein
MPLSLRVMASGFFTLRVLLARFFVNSPFSMRPSFESALWSLVPLAYATAAQANLTGSEAFNVFASGAGQYRNRACLRNPFAMSAFASRSRCECLLRESGSPLFE